MRTLFIAYQKKLAHLMHVKEILAWDEATMMPKKAYEGRAQQIGYIATLSHEIVCDPAYHDLVEQLLSKKDELLPWQQRSLVLAQKEITQTIRLDASFVERYETAKSQAQTVRREARRTNDFALFAPHLEKGIEFAKMYAQQIEPTKDPYDTLLDIYEEDATQERYDACLLPLQKPLTELLHAIPSKDLGTTGADRLTKHETKKLLHELTKTVGFDLDAGMLGEVHHPFMTTLGAYDYRINTRYTHPVEAITGMIHELGHGLYEQRVDPTYFYTNLHYGASTGMHESQSRTLENMIGRSKGMSVYLDRLSKTFGKKYTGTATLWYDVCTNVQPSLIRVEADEVSYGLHVLLRYELEKELLGGSLSVHDLPSAWNEKMQTYLGITPPTDTLGCLQDVHRSCGLFGYFPTYLLGNVYGAQFWKSFQEAHPDRERAVSQGNFQAYFSRYKDHIWSHGSALSPKDVLMQATGHDVDPTYFLTYLTDKYT